MAKIEEVEGIGPAYAEKLAHAGITTTEQLLEKGATAKGRSEIASATQLTESQVLKWVNHCDLMRIKGIGSEYSDLLEASGVDSVPELAQRVFSNLAKKMEEVNNEKKLVRSLPSENQVADWIEQAKTIDRIVTH